LDFALTVGACGGLTQTSAPELVPVVVPVSYGIAFLAVDIAFVRADKTGPSHWEAISEAPLPMPAMGERLQA
jgi:hypothetical protein